MSITGIIQGIRQAGKAKNTTEQDSGEPTFFRFIWQEKRHRRFVWIALAGTIIQFVIFKILYPFADFFSDSYSYILAAKANLDINIWPIGYSKFLRAFHFISHSDTALVGFQYFFFELTALHFFFSVLYFFKPVKANQVILFIFLFFNPLFLYVCNYVNSDPIFIALSMIWFTQLIWIIYRPMRRQVFMHAIVLFLCFTIRNNAYYYPLVSFIVFLLSEHRKQIKAIGILLPALLIGWFIHHTREAAYKLTGTRMFSLFTGWQLANNALYAYVYMDTAKNLASPELKELDKFSRLFYSQASYDFFNKLIRSDQGNFFIRAPYSPLKIYYNKYYPFVDDISSIGQWGKASVVFGQYGTYLIKHNISAYAWEFMVPNVKNYFIPPLEKLHIYNLGQNKVDEIAQNWFDYKSTKVSSVSKDIQGSILYLMPALFLLLNIYMLGCIGLFYLKKRQTITNSSFNKILIATCIFHMINFAFCVFATIIVLRYQVFPFIICLTFSLLLTEYLDKKETKNEPEIQIRKGLKNYLQY